MTPPVRKAPSWAIEVGSIKKDRNLNVYVPEREVEILRRLTAVNEGPFPNDGLKAIYREIISASLSLEKPLSVAFLGPKATFTHLACLKHFGESAEYVPQINLSGVFDAVVRNAANSAWGRSRTAARGSSATPAKCSR